MSSSKTSQIAAVCHGAVDLRIVSMPLWKQAKPQLMRCRKNDPSRLLPLVRPSCTSA